MVAFDAVSGTAISGTTHSSRTWSHTTSGSDRILLVIVCTYNSTGGGKVSGVTYNGVPMTLYGTEMAQQSNQHMSVFYLLNPTVGTNNIVATWSVAQTYSWCASASYNGVNQSSFPDNEVNGLGSGTSFGSSITPNESDCLLVMLAMGNRDKAAGTNMTMRTEQFNNLQGVAIGDSNVTYSTATTMTMTQVTSDSWGYRTFTLAPAGGGGGGQNSAMLALFK